MSHSAPEETKIIENYINNQIKSICDQYNIYIRRDDLSPGIVVSGTHLENKWLYYTGCRIYKIYGKQNAYIASYYLSATQFITQARNHTGWSEDLTVELFDANLLVKIDNWLLETLLTNIS